MRGKILTMAILAALLAGCQKQSAQTANGYAEGEYVTVAAPEGGWLTQVLVTRGAQIKVGDALFVLDAETQTAQRDQALAQLNQAQAQLADAKKGRRSDEIAAIEAALAQARASLALAETDLRRTQDLNGKGFASQAALDAKRAQRDVTASQVKQSEANLAQARKGARQDEIAAADANVASAKAALERAAYALSQRRILSKVDGRIEDVLRRTGEFVSPGGAVVSLLPPGNTKIRFFVPEAARASLNIGREVGVRCDGCGEGLKARVTFIASDAEFTPPVIYSVGSREKLVWMVEAVPTRAGRLSPGQPVDVTLP
ncbi:MAG: HlyD family efflux transporter periplasmic adaptor subunit [Alphaproteobacteria bacterium]|nr:HlyD family efflux transporter periplasmic adaptor subunit [Alphaproteobacteria bacterium]